MDIRMLVENYLKSLDTSEKLADFLSFAAKHPELSLENDCLLLLQKPDAGRYFVHRGLADYYGYPTDKPISLLTLTANDNRFVSEGIVLYEVPEDRLVVSLKGDNRMRAVFDRIGYSLCPTDAVTELKDDPELRRLSYPKSWNTEETNDALIRFYVDYFWQKYRDVQQSVQIGDQKWKQRYRTAMIFMVSRLLGYNKTMLPKTFFLFINDDTKNEQYHITERYFQMVVTLALFVELDQAIEGRHLTLYETRMFQLTNGQPYSSELGDDNTNDDDFSIFLTYQAFLIRYVDMNLERIDVTKVHIYPPTKVLA